LYSDETVLDGSSTRDLLELTEEGAFDIDAYQNVSIMAERAVDPLTMSLVFIEIEEKWETVKTLLEAPSTETSLVISPNAKTYTKIKKSHRELSDLTHGLEGSIGQGVFGVVVYGVKYMSVAISAWVSVEVSVCPKLYAQSESLHVHTLSFSGSCRSH